MERIMQANGRTTSTRNMCDKLAYHCSSAAVLGFDLGSVETAVCVIRSIGSVRSIVKEGIINSTQTMYHGTFRTIASGDTN